MFELGFKKEADELFDIAFAKLLATNSSAWHNTSSPIIEYQIRKGDLDAVLAVHEKLTKNGMLAYPPAKIRWLCGMGKFEDAIALADETKSTDWEPIAEGLLVANRKEEVKEVLKKMLISGTNAFGIEIMYKLLQAGMFDEFSHYIEQFPDAGDKAHLLSVFSSYLRADGNIADADRMLLEAMKQVEKMPVNSHGGRHLKLQQVLSPLILKPPMKQSLFQFD